MAREYEIFKRFIIQEILYVTKSSNITCKALDIYVLFSLIANALLHLRCGPRSSVSITCCILITIDVGSLGVHLYISEIRLSKCYS